MKENRSVRIAIDTGGTFTDCLWLEDGQVKMVKVFSTPEDPSIAIVEGLRRTGFRGGRLVLLHGTTVGTNALLERKGARVAFLTTEGFEDSIEIGRQARPKLYDFFFDRVAPLVPCDMRFGVPERTDSEGRIIRRPDGPELKRVAEIVARTNPDSVAVSLLFSFANPENECAAAAALTQAGVRVPLSLSHKILPEFREYERASTVVVNAYLQPVMGNYLEKLDRRVGDWLTQGEDGSTESKGTGQNSKRSGLHEIFVMQSSGGITSLESAAREAVRTVLSGPAGGVVGSSAMGRRSGFERVIGFDMGGTSTDVALVEGVPRTSNEAEVAGLPVRVPMLDIHTVGAGGGSLARFDAAGALRVGPESAGADPGPICYGKGEQPTVTDANLILGRLRPDAFLGGDFVLDVERTRRVGCEWLKANRSKMSIEEFASGVVRVVNATMEKAVRVVSVERGYDTRDFSLVAFGGAGALHAAELAAGLGIPRVIVPEFPGALSAFGILVSDIVKDYSRTVLIRVGPGCELPRQRLDQEFRDLSRAAERDFSSEGFAKPELEMWGDLRYRGQGFELSVPFGSDMLAHFEAEHERRYGYRHPQREIEIVTLRLRARLASPEEALKSSRTLTRPTGKSHAPQRSQVIFDGNSLSAAIYDRESLNPAHRYKGPAIVTEYSATTVVPPGMKFFVDGAGALVIETAPHPTS